MPMGAIFGTLFFGSLTIAGFTSLFSLLEVVVSGVKDKLNLERKTAAIGVGVAMALLGRYQIKGTDRASAGRCKRSDHCNEFESGR